MIRFVWRTQFCYQLRLGNEGKSCAKTHTCRHHKMKFVKIYTEWNCIVFGCLFNHIIVIIPYTSHRYTSNIQQFVGFLSQFLHTITFKNKNCIIKKKNYKEYYPWHSLLYECWKWTNLSLHSKYITIMLLNLYAYNATWIKFRNLHSITINLSKRLKAFNLNKRIRNDKIENRIECTLWREKYIA